MNDLKKKVKAAANGARRPMETSPLELFILLSFVTVPMFILAHELDGDEFLKGISGVAFAGCMAALMAFYKIWKGK